MKISCIIPVVNKYKQFIVSYKIKQSVISITKLNYQISCITITKIFIQDAVKKNFFSFFRRGGLQYLCFGLRLHLVGLIATLCREIESTQVLVQFHHEQGTGPRYQRDIVLERQVAQVRHRPRVYVRHVPERLQFHYSGSASRGLVEQASGE